MFPCPVYGDFTKSLMQSLRGCNISLTFIPVLCQQTELRMKQSYTKNSLNGYWGKLPLMASIAGLLFAAGCKKQDYPLPPGEVNKVKHIVVIYLENNSFVNLYAS